MHVFNSVWSLSSLHPLMSSIILLLLRNSPCHFQVFFVVVVFVFVCDVNWGLLHRHGCEANCCTGAACYWLHY